MIFAHRQVTPILGDRRTRRRVAVGHVPTDVAGWGLLDLGQAPLASLARHRLLT